jgi:protein-tyrosine phosphatase
MTSSGSAGTGDRSPTRVLFVCLGNICRSPAAEGVFLHHLQREGLSPRFAVDSAGTAGWHIGKRPDSRMQAAASRRGILLPSRARRICSDDLHHFDHILTMDEDNLTKVRTLARGLSYRASIQPLMTYAQLPGIKEVPDPYYGGPEGFEHVLDLLEDACTGLLRALKRASMI